MHPLARNPHPICHAKNCPEPATVQWARRSTDAEWAAHVALCRQRVIDNGYPEHYGVHPDALVPKDGIALQVMHACDAHKPAGDTGAPHPADCTVPCVCD